MWLFFAEAIKWSHILFMFTVALSPLLVSLLGVWGLLVQVLMVLMVLFCNRLAKGRCPWTLMEGACRRRYTGRKEPIKGLTRRILESILRRDVPESSAALVAYSIAVVAVANGLLIVLVGVITRWM